MRTLRLHTAKSRRALKPSSFAAWGDATRCQRRSWRWQRDASVSNLLQIHLCAAAAAAAATKGKPSAWQTFGWHAAAAATGATAVWRVYLADTRYTAGLFASLPACQLAWPGRGAIYTSVNCLASCPTAASGISNAATNFKLNAKRFRLLAQPSSILYLVYCILYLLASILYLCIWHRLSCV